MSIRVSFFVNTRNGIYMAQYFFIFFIFSYAIVIGISVYLLKRIKQEKALYDMFSKNGDIRKLMANDPLRFHNSIIYLMTYMARSDGDGIQYDKLRMIVRYIKEVVPQEYQKDAITTLKTLTERYKTEGKHTSSEYLIDVDKFMSGLNCIETGDNSYNYYYPLHGKRLAEELGLYLSETDRLYVMFLLYRLAVADKAITTEGKMSEMYILNRLCVDGLKINKNELDNLINEFKSGNDIRWYEEHFHNKEVFYPSYNVLADIFRMDMTSISLLNKKIPKSSALGSIFIVSNCSCPLLVFLLSLFFIFEINLFGTIYSSVVYIIGIIAILSIIILNLVASSELETSCIPILRSVHEDELQKRRLILYSISTFILIVSLFWFLSNTWFLVANDIFACKKSFVVSVPITGKNYERSNKKFSYYVTFKEVSLENIQFDDYQGSVSGINSFFVNSLPWLSGMKNKEVKNTKTMSLMQVSSHDYHIADGKNIELHFKVGYFGLVYYKCFMIKEKKE